MEALVDILFISCKRISCLFLIWNDPTSISATVNSVTYDLIWNDPNLDILRLSPATDLKLLGFLPLVVVVGYFGTVGRAAITIF